MADRIESTLRALIQVMHDGHLGLAEIGHHLEDQRAKEFFLKESLTREQFAGELENELIRHGVHDVKEGGTAAGAVHRAWGELKAHLGGGDHTLLATAEQGEDQARQAYKDAIDEGGLPLPLTELLRSQLSHLTEAHTRIKAFRENKAA